MRNALLWRAGTLKPRHFSPASPEKVLNAECLMITASYKELTKKLDRIFSVYIRLKNADGKGFCKCITCGKMHHYKDIHNGHFIPRDRKATRFHEMNCHPQCVYCNYHKHGQPDIYRTRLTEMYGKEEVEKLERLAQMGGSDDSISLQLKIKEYKEKVKALKKGKDLGGNNGFFTYRGRSCYISWAMGF